MSLAPEPYLSAYLKVLQTAILVARRMAWEGQYHGEIPVEEIDRLADLMDAVHNIPDLLTRWEECDEPRLREFLEMWDEKWLGRVPGVWSLMGVYREAMAGPKA